MDAAEKFVAAQGWPGIVFQRVPNLTEAKLLTKIKAPPTATGLLYQAKGKRLASGETQNVRGQFEDQSDLSNSVNRAFSMGWPWLDPPREDGYESFCQRALSHRLVGFLFGRWPFRRPTKI